jgi:hypothetical protein
MSAQHKFAVGQTVRFLPDLGQGSPGSESFKIVRLLPEAARVLQYGLRAGWTGMSV